MYILQNSNSTIPRPKGAQTPFNCHIYPNCWQIISNTNIHIQLSNIPQLLADIQYKYAYSADTYSPIVGSVYPI